MKLFGIAGYSGSGKTTLIERVLPLLVARGLKVAVIKHTHHDFDIDPPPGGGRGCKGAEAPTTTHRPGKDSWRAREAGAAAVLLSSDHRTALLIEHRDTPPSLNDLLAQLPPCDLVLVEGYKQEPIPKLEVHRAATGKPWLFPDDPHILAVASDIAPPAALLIRNELAMNAGRALSEGVSLGTARQVGLKTDLQPGIKDTASITRIDLDAIPFITDFILSHALSHPTA